MAALHQRVPTTLCAKCRVAFKPGDRVLTAYIVTKIGRNPETKDIGAWLHDDFELAHVACADPCLEGKLIT